jgi:hypothetical protein
MPTAPDETDLVAASDRRRRLWVVCGAVLLPVVLILIGGTGHPELGFVVIALVFPALWAVGQIRGQRTREGTDERALDSHRRAASFSWQIMAVVLAAATAWTAVQHGIRAAEPYLVLGGALVVSYLAALLWRRWRGL